MDCQFRSIKEAALRTAQEGEVEFKVCVCVCVYVCKYIYACAYKLCMMCGPGHAPFASLWVRDAGR
jgi:hypothetical protein